MSGSESGADAAGLTRRQWAGFFALCLLGASGWLVEGAWPSVLPSAAKDFLHDAAVGLFVGLFAIRKISGASFAAKPWAKLSGASIAVLGVPVVLIDAARLGVSDGTEAGFFALLPIAVVLVVAQLEPRFSTGRLLAPALIGLAGTLLLVPFSLPDSLHAAGLSGLVLLSAILTAAASVWMYKLLREFAVIEAVMICCFANAAFFAAVSLGSSAVTSVGFGSAWSGQVVGVEAAKALGLDLPELLLLLWLMREVQPVRLAARAWVIPLLTLAEGEVLMRPGFEARTLAGAVLLVYGAWRLMTDPEQDVEPGLMLR